MHLFAFVIVGLVATPIILAMLVLIGLILGITDGVAFYVLSFICTILGIYLAANLLFLLLKPKLPSKKEEEC